MKEAILEILRKGNDVHEFTSEIAEMMTAFIEWIRTSDTLDNNINDWICGKITNDKLFTYWHTEIYKK